MPRISSVHSREILDSRGNPTVEVEVRLDDGAMGRASVPSGASTGKAEAVELRDGDMSRYRGRGVRKAVENVKFTIGVALQGLEALDQNGVDRQLLELDGTSNKCHLGANALLGVSLAVARAAAASLKMPLYRHLGGPTATELPVPMVNILSGGIHGGANFDFQDFLVVPLRTGGYAQALEDVAAVYLAMKDVLKDRGIFHAGAADEGGYAPRLESNEDGFSLMVEAIERAGLRPGEDAAIAVDLAASQFGRMGTYRLAIEGIELSSAEMVDRLAQWVDRYPILSIEDGLDEDDWNGWSELTRRLGACCQLVTDDLTATNLSLLKKAIDASVGNTILVKMNQVGTLTETLEVVNLARLHGYRTIVSARSGETEDDLLADLAVATRSTQIKVGCITRSERLAKYNRLLRIEEELSEGAIYRGAAIFRKPPVSMKG